MGTWNEAKYLHYEASKGGDILEVGTGAGGSAIIMAKALNDASVSGVIETIDWKPDKDEYRKVKAKISQCKWSNKIKYHIGKSEDLLPTFADQQFRFIYIDGDHEYSSVVSDIQNCIRLLKLNGIIAFHDTNKKSVSKAIKENISWSLVAEVDRIKGFLKEK